MAVTKNTQEIKVSSISPKRMFTAMAIESHTLLPKIMPGAIKSIDLLHGDGGAGTISQTNLLDGGFVKHKIHAVDAENCTTKYSMIGGVFLGDKLESINYDVKFEGSGDGGCLVKIVSEYHTKGDVAFKEEEIKAGKDQAIGLYTTAQQYLIANPHACA